LDFNGDPEGTRTLGL